MITIDANLIVNLLLFIVSTILAFFSIWLALRLDREASRTQSEIKILLAEIRSVARITQRTTDAYVGKAFDYFLLSKPAHAQEELQRFEERLRRESEERLERAIQKLEEEVKVTSLPSVTKITNLLQEDTEQQKLLTAVKNLRYPLSLVVLSEALLSGKASSDRLEKGYPGIPPTAPDETSEIVRELESKDLVRHAEKWIYPSELSVRHKQTILELTLPLLPDEVQKNFNK